MVPPSLDPVSGLSHSSPHALGIAPETEASHFTHIIEPYAIKLGLSVNDYMERYNVVPFTNPNWTNTCCRTEESANLVTTRLTAWT